MRYHMRATSVAAAQWFKNGDHPDDYSKSRLLLEGGQLVTKSGDYFREHDMEGAVVRRFRRPDTPAFAVCPGCDQQMQQHGWIENAKGGHIVCPGDWVLTDNAGVTYPMKAKAFATTYEPDGAGE